jgi:hypothetical protein
MGKYDVESSYEGEQQVVVDGKDYLVCFYAYATGYDDPGYTSGPPEGCYPPEGELEITEINPKYILDELGDEVTDPDLRKKIMEALDEDVIMDKLWQYIDKPQRPNYV